MWLVAENLAGARGGETLFERLDFRVGPGELLAVTGPNGAGKTTLLRMAAGLLPPVDGRIAIAEAYEDGMRLGDACHFLAAQNAMKLTLSVAENLRFWRDFLQSAAPDAFRAELRLDVEAALDAVGLAQTRDLPFGALSTGQRRRVAIARLLVAHRPIWLLDEPLAGLDARAEARFAELLGAHLANGGSAVAAVHGPLGITPTHTLQLGASH
ncbi:MAG: heme ABC exporter ATP-binding protein CcmA [Mesorhizobium amorphae]|nr:MAG: heme ABC exporter ATP-binding protein CcmA [Mesorhizobium amorphae]